MFLFPDMFGKVFHVYDVEFFVSAIYVVTKVVVQCLYRKHLQVNISDSCWKASLQRLFFILSIF